MEIYFQFVFIHIKFSVSFINVLCELAGVAGKLDFFN